MDFDWRNNLALKQADYILFISIILTQQFQTTISKEVNANIRYYSLKLYLTLFGEFLLIRAFGASKNKAPTRIMKKYFFQIEDALIEMEYILSSKIAKGYMKYHHI